MSDIRVGSRVGSHEVTAKLGEGGMGEVYRATDTRLRRDVAIKVLPAAFTADRERLERFEREAQLLAQLQHSNIAAIYGIEETNGTQALVMELVEGEDLSVRLARGALPLDEAVAIARQIAEALEAAHERGIVHRDLKPANVKVRPDGTVKVLDFGLAKALEPGGSAASGGDPALSPAGNVLANSPTLTRTPGTEIGVILGTAAYMSPEQARGGAIDERADVWAFGVVLYEMLTGGRLFQGESVIDTVSAVMRQPVELDRLPEATPRALRELMRRCLERNRRSRLHSIADARIVLEEIERGEASEDGQRGGGETGATAHPAGAVRGPVFLAALAALALAAGWGAGWLLRRPPAASAAATARWALAIPDGYTLSTDQFPQLALSEDGRLQVAVVLDASATPHLLLRSMDAAEPRLLPDTAGAASPFFSPDGSWLGFFRPSGALVKIPTAGGPPVELARVGSPTTTRRGGTWSRDGYIYLSSDVATALSRISEDGGPVTPVTRLDDARDERTHRWPQALPDGSAVLFTCDTHSSTEYYDDARIEAVRPATGERRVLVEGSSHAQYAGGGNLVFARGGSLYAVAFDPVSLTVSGTPQLVAQGVATDVGSGAAQFALSSSGAALWAPGGLAAGFDLVWVDRSGAETPVGVPAEPFNEVALSPDGRRAALVGGSGGAGDLWIADLERGSLTRLTVNEVVAAPVWSPDGTRIAYGLRVRRGNERRWQMAWQLADGSRDAEVLLESALQLLPSALSADGRQLLFSEFEDLGSVDVHVLDLDGTGTGRARRPLIDESRTKFAAVPSPDGRWVAYVSSEGGQPYVFVRPFPSGEGRWQVSSSSASEPRWSPDGRELFFRSSSVLHRVSVDAAQGFSSGRPEPLFDRAASAGLPSTYSPGGDGRFLALRTPTGRGALRTVHLDLGFVERLGGARRTAAQP